MKDYIRERPGHFNFVISHWGSKNIERDLRHISWATATDQKLHWQFDRAQAFEDVKGLARAQGYGLGELSSEEAARTFDVVTSQIQNEELTEKHLEMIAGGILIDFPGAGFKSGELSAPRRVKWYTIETVRQSPYIGETEKN